MAPHRRLQRLDRSIIGIAAVPRAHLASIRAQFDGLGLRPSNNPGALTMNSSDPNYNVERQATDNRCSAAERCGVPAAVRQPSRQIPLAIAFFAALSLATSPAAGAEIKGTVKIIVPSTPGGGADVVARLLAQQIGRAQNVTMVVEDRPGGGNIVGIEAAARSAPNGNTVLISTPEFVINPHLQKVNYDPLKGFESVCYLARAPQVLVVNPVSPYKTFTDFLTAAQKNPGKLTLASTSPASSPHIAFETIRRAAKVDILYVPFQGSHPAVSALLGQQVTSAMVSYPNVLAQISSGKLRPLAVTSENRVEDIPNVPTIAESGFPGLQADLWFGTEVPANTPKAAIAQLSSWFSAALKRPEVKSKLKSLGLTAVGTCGDEFSKFIHHEYEQYGREISEGHIQAK